ncbi:hypothetical protein [Accumulibacter sp.]|uniref:hypothetical protein n=1 Tax=Accumulibacter sp. TaxID=2053492 RepID=UPI0025D189D7|nr:hypothetical protein [Accumulibacter sp.]MCP5229925.1 hypothetical protein [Accumulibacter sp.]
MEATRLFQSGLRAGPGKHFVQYFVHERRFVNFVAVIEQDICTRQSRTDQGDVADALAASLSTVDAQNVPDALRGYEILRLPGASPIQALSATNKTRYHLRDGLNERNVMREWHAARLPGQAALGSMGTTPA